MRNDRVDVRSKGDVGKLMDLIQKNKIVLVLVYADWCGHCQTFKKDIWQPLSTMPNRKVPIAAVNESVLADTPSVASAKIDGYPSVLMMGQDMKPAVFNSESGEPTNAMPNSRNLEAMKTIVTADPEVVLASGPASANVSRENEDEDEPMSLTSTPSAEEQLNNAAENVVNDMGELSASAAATASAAANEPRNESLSKVVSNPPDVEDDIASAIHPPGQALNSMGRTILGQHATGAQEGGSLYLALLEASKGVLPAAALTAAAIYVDKRTRRRGRRSSRGTAKKLRR